ncbi:unnamed protein product [Hyaloperonospora brassicae]|uniref:Uncharacterized protein n=1 Tax=Hyaloperonospora brassicae TaxID=162125 RepID=A0AAV0UHX7_HYABA|nr:unnamed protein product [Hyaloperonospora brassicae]
MFPLLMPPLQPPLTLTTPESGAPDAVPPAEAAETSGDALPSYLPAGAESLALGTSFGGADGFGLLSGSSTLPAAVSAPATSGGGGVFNMDDDVPKRKRGRPPKKDVAARAKGDVEKALKQQQQQQLPFWGYGLPMPLLPGFPPAMLSGMSNPGAVVLKDPSAAAAAACEDELLAQHEGDVERPSKPAKKKQRGTGKPRGRPRTRPRPGELIRRVKPLPIAPANFSVMYNYSLSNLAHKSAELHGDGTTAGTDDAQDRGLASLLSGEHE